MSAFGRTGEGVQPVAGVKFWKVTLATPVSGSATDAVRTADDAAAGRKKTGLFVAD